MDAEDGPIESVNGSTIAHDEQGAYAPADPATPSATDEPPTVPGDAAADRYESHLYVPLEPFQPRRASHIEASRPGTAKLSSGQMPQAQQSTSAATVSPILLLLMFVFLLALMFAAYSWIRGFASLSAITPAGIGTGLALCGLAALLIYRVQPPWRIPAMFAAAFAAAAIIAFMQPRHVDIQTAAEPPVLAQASAPQPAPVHSTPAPILHGPAVQPVFPALPLGPAPVISTPFELVIPSVAVPHASQPQMQATHTPKATSTPQRQLASPPRMYDWEFDSVPRTWLTSGPEMPDQPTPLLEDSPEHIRQYGAFGFPQSAATVLSDGKQHRLSLASDAHYLYIQAVHFEQSAISRAGRVSPIDSGSITLVKPPYIEPRSISYGLNHLPNARGLVGMVPQIVGNHMNGARRFSSSGRGSIRWARSGSGPLIRIDSFLLPLAELGTSVGATLKIISYGFTYAGDSEAAFHGTFSERAKSRHHVGVMGQRRSDDREYRIEAGPALQPDLVPNDYTDQSIKTVAESSTFATRVQ